MGFVDEEFLYKKMFIKTFICGLWCAIEDFPEDGCRVNKLVGHYGDLTSLN